MQNLFYLYLLLAAINDFFHMKIPNYLTFGVFPFILAYRFYLDSWAGVFDGLLAYVLAIAIFFYPFVKRGVGAADLKFLANIGAFVGIAKLVPCIFYGLICSIPALLYFILKYGMQILHAMRFKESAHLEPIKFPYAPPFAIGTFIYLEDPHTFPFF